MVLTEVQREMVDSNMGLVHAIANSIRATIPNRVDIEDLEQDGLVGLLQAVQNYDPTLAQPGTYFRFRIRGAMLDSLRKVDYLTRPQRTLMKKIVTLQQDRITDRHFSQEQSLEVYLQRHGITQEEYEEGRSLRAIQTFSLHVHLNGGNDDDGHVVDPPDMRHSPDEQLRVNGTIQQVTLAMKQLPIRHREVMQLYYFDELNMRQIGQIMSIVESRVSQMHRWALDRMNEFLNPDAPPRKIRRRAGQSGRTQLKNPAVCRCSQCSERN